MTALSVRHKQEKAFLQARCEGQVSVVTQLRQQLKDRTAAEQRLVEQVSPLAVLGDLWGLDDMC
jgi:hypothetical protein